LSDPPYYFVIPVHWPDLSIYFALCR
jgi:hypothetical protein